jgi:shikimate dehydrogenase
MAPERERGTGGPGAAEARAAVLGSPIAHSLSPVLHSAAYAELGLTGWTYEAIECTEQEFGAWFGGLGPQWRGLSLTMPLKRVVLPMLSRISPLARAVSAVNTVTWDGDRLPVGDNTDVHGIVEALRSAGVEAVSSACILGAGATASSAIAALAELGCQEVVVQARASAGNAQVFEVADRLGVHATAGGLDQVKVALEAEVVVATLPAGAAADWSQTLPAARPAGVLLDVTYHPWPTVPAATWTAAGGIAVGGFEMLLHQAGAQFTLMTGRPAPIEAMRAAGRLALGSPPKG